MLFTPLLSPCFLVTLSISYKVVVFLVSTLLWEWKRLLDTCLLKREECQRGVWAAVYG